MKNKRSDSYFGMHFDFHADKFAKEIGSKTTRESFGKYLDEVKLDYIQIDTKGHPGYASYFSKYGDVAPGLTVDQLKMIREETKRRGIALYAHHSSLWDEVAISQHPEWAIVDANGNISEKYIDLSSEYADKKFIFMVKELCEEYGFDGVWVDGDCWCVYENYRPEFVQKFYEESGMGSIDNKNISSPSYIAFRKFCKKEYEKFVKHYIKEIKKDYPDFEICSNYAFTSRYPEKPFDGIDFLSADIYDLKMRLVPRCFASHDKPWDIMSWGRPNGLPAKESVITGCVSCNNHIDVTMRMAARAISLGGGFQNIGNMTAQGEMVFYEMENMKKLHEFMEERKPYNYKSTPLENAAIWISQKDRDYMPPDEGRICDFDALDEGICDTVIDGGRPVDIIFDYHIEEDKISEHNVIIIPETWHIDEELKKKLVGYVNGGGNLIVTGVNSCKAFAEFIDAQIKDFDGNAVYVEQKSNPYYMAGCQKAVLFEHFKGETVCNCYVDKMDHSANQVVISPVVELGKGKIIYLGWDIMRQYYNNHRYVLPYIMNDALCIADKKPNAYLKSGTNRVEIIPAKKDDMLFVNVINTSEHYYYNCDCTYGDIPAICDIEIAVRCGVEPKSISLQPQNKKAEFTYDGEYAYVKLSKLHIHTIIVVEGVI